MRIFKVDLDHLNCKGCLTSITKGQAKATSYIYGANLCVKCVSGHTKLDSVLKTPKHLENYVNRFINNLSYSA